LDFGGARYAPLGGGSAEGSTRRVIPSPPGRTWKVARSAVDGRATVNESWQRAAGGEPAGIGSRPL
jgi:hypothetical protein